MTLSGNSSPNTAGRERRQLLIWDWQGAVRTLKVANGDEQHNPEKSALEGADLRER